MIKKLLSKFVVDHKYPLMRQPDQLPRCYEMTEDERLSKIKEWQNRNVWNDPKLSNEDKNIYYGA
jgi:hypothetical protein